MAVSLAEEPRPLPSAYSEATQQPKMGSRVHSCPNCGSELPPERELEDARRRIKELEAQVEMLKEKATAAGEC